MSAPVWCPVHHCAHEGAPCEYAVESVHVTGFWWMLIALAADGIMLGSAWQR